jgi:hypothetical protein
MRISAILAALLGLALVAPLPAFAWGATGHRIINGDAARTLPDSVPPFIRTPEAIAEITALGPEADRDRGAGKTRDADWDPAHFLDLDDDGTIGGTLKLSELPPTREAYDTALRNGAKPTDQYDRGYVQYEIVDGYELLVKDFGIWRVDSFAEAHAANAADKAFYGNDRKLRETLILRDIGFWGHFVGDASQPLHISIHFNGWGNYPNPNNYTQSKKIHSKFESDFVNAHTSADATLSHIGPYVPAPGPILPRVEAYIAQTNTFVPKVYQLEGAGAFDAVTPDAVNFTLDRLAAGAKMMRDLIADAYAESVNAKVGYPEISVQDVLSGKVTPTHGLADGG